MDQQNNSDIQKRVERLEQLVERLAVKVEKILPDDSPRATATLTPPPPPRQQHIPLQPPAPPKAIEKPRDQVRHSDLSVGTSTEPAFKIPEHMKRSEFWLNKIGIALLLFGAVFLFKYSVEQGWLTPTIRIFFGLALGAGLSVIGLRLYHKRKHFSQVLLGGAFGTFYITGFAAFQMFHLISYPVALSFCITVTALSFYLSLKENDFIFSLIAMLGGLGTPFLLYTGAGSVPQLMVYLCILLAGASAIYFFKGWWSFFWTTCIGGWTIIWIAMFNKAGIMDAPMADKIALQAALFLTLPFFWLTPLGREVTILKRPEMPASTIPPPVEKAPNEPDINYSEINLNLLVIITPALAFFITSALWNWGDNVWGGISLAMAIVIAGVGWWLDKQTGLKALAYTHFNVGLVFGTLAIYNFFDGDTLLVAFVLEAVALHLVKIKIGNRILAPIAHTMSAISALWVASRIFESQSGNAILNMRTMSDLVVPAGAMTLSFLFSRVKEKRIYFVSSIVLLAGIFYRELSGNDYFLTLTLLSSAMAYLVGRLKDKDLFYSLNIFNAAIASWLGFRLFESATGNAIFNYTAAVDLLFIVYLVIYASFRSSRDEKSAYLIGAHIAVLLWLLRELSPLTNGQGIVSAAWGIYIVGLFVLGLRKDTKIITKTAMATLLVLIGKLFLVDLANLETIWRVLLFLSFGAVLLFLSYYFQSLWKGKQGEAQPPSA